ncbi:MAG: hypothetical protein ACW99F_06210 [Candidatus Hodarchaeales archaeon]|jgi:hypothetical protein
MNKAYVREDTFQPFTGVRKGKLRRMWAIAWFNLVYQWKRSFLVKIWIGFIVFMLILSNLMIFAGPAYLMPESTPNEILEEHLWGTVRKFVRFQVLIAAPADIDPVFDTGYSIFILIGIIMIGAGLISDDKRTRMTEIYDSRIHRREYLVSKFSSLILFGNILLTIPSIIEWILLIIGIEGVNILKAIPVLLGVVLFTEVCILVIAGFVLTFSSLTQKRLYAGIFSFSFFLLVSKVISYAIGVVETFTPIIYLDFFTVLSVLSYWIQGEKSVIYYDTSLNGIDFNFTIDLTSQAGMLLFPFIGFFISFSLLICFYQVVWKHNSPFQKMIAFSKRQL